MLDMTVRKQTILSAEKMARVKLRLDPAGLDADCVLGALTELTDIIRKAETRIDESSQTDLSKNEIEEIKEIFEVILEHAPEQLTEPDITAAITHYGAASAARLSAWARKQANVEKIDQEQIDRNTVDGKMNWRDAALQLFNSIVGPIRVGKGIDNLSAGAWRAPLARIADSESETVLNKYNKKRTEVFEGLRDKGDPIGKDPHRFMEMVNAAKVGVREMPDMEGGTIPKEIIDFADWITQQETSLFKRLTDAGVPMVQIQDYIERPELNWSDMHDQREQIKAFFAAHLDTDFLGKFKDNEARTKAIDAYVESWLKKSKHRKEGSGGSREKTAWAGQKYNRVLKFNSPDAEFLFYKQWAAVDANVAGSIEGQLDKLARRTAIHEQVGMGGIETLDIVYNKYMSRALDADQITKKEADILDEEWAKRKNTATGQYTDPTRSLPTLGLFMASTAHLFRSNVLSNLIRIAPLDAVNQLNLSSNMAIHSSSIRDAKIRVGRFFDTMSQQMQLDRSKGEDGRTATQWAVDALGLSHIWAQGMADNRSAVGFSQRNRARYAEGRVADLVYKYAEKTDAITRFNDRINPIGWADRRRLYKSSALTASSISHAVRLEAKLSDLKNLQPVLYDLLNQYGFTEAQWKKLSDYKEFSDPNAGYGAARHLLDFETMSFKDPQLHRQVAALTRGYAEMAIGRPDVHMKRVFTANTRSDSTLGILLRSLMMFKSYFASVAMVRIPQQMRNWHLLSTRNPENHNGRRYAAVAGQAFMSSTLAGMGVVALTELIDGEDPREMDEWEFVLRGIGYGAAGVLIDPLLWGLKQNREGATLRAFREGFSVVSPAMSVPAQVGSGASHFVRAMVEDGTESDKQLRLLADDIVGLTPIKYHTATRWVSNEILNEWLFDLDKNKR